MYAGNFAKLIVTESPSLSLVLGNDIGITYYDPISIII